MRAFEDVKAIAQAPHPVGSTENLRVREYLFARMQQLGLKPREIVGQRNGVKVVNLYGQLEGTQLSNPPILLIAHYDSTPHGPGAADDASGVATILETVRALTARGRLPNTLGILLTDGEELPGVLLGSATFVHDQPDLVRDLRVVVNLEARGNHGPVLMFQTGHDNDGLIQFFSRACPLPVAASFSEEIYRRMPNDTDFTEFMKAGKRGFNFAFVGGIRYYHRPEDTPANLSLRTLQHYGECVLPLAMRLSQADDAALERCLQPGDATFFPLWRGLLVHYPAWLARVLAWLTAGLFILAACRGILSAALRVRFVMASLGVILLTASLAFGVGLGVVFGSMRHFKAGHYGPFVVGVPFAGGVLAGVLVLSAVITVALRVWLLRRAKPSEALAGSLVMWVALTLIMNKLLPGASYLFAWPAFFGAIALLLSCDVPGRPRVRMLLPIILTALPAPLLFAPAILLMHQAITIGIAPISAAIAALVFGLVPVGQLPEGWLTEATPLNQKTNSPKPAAIEKL